MPQSTNTNPMHLCYLGLGGNIENELGTPKDHINQAVVSLKSNKHIDHVRVSSLYASKPLGPQDQPDFVNAVVEMETELAPHEVLDLCQSLEKNAQRVKLRRWGERSLDVDVLLYDNLSIETPTLTVPHPGIMQRNFVLVPLAELNPNLHLEGKPILQHPLSQDWTGLSKLV